MGILGMERLHPFDTHKFSKAAKVLEQTLGSEFTSRLIAVDRAVTRDELAGVHDSEYLDSVGSAAVLAKIFEVPAAAYVPAMLLDHGILTPMRWACRGSVLAIQAAREHGFAINLGGGFHHAKPDRGEGFCVYSDFALMRQELRSSETAAQTILYVDTDAHQGNGVCHFAMSDQNVRVFDIFNSEIYPRHDVVARNRIDHAVPMECFASGRDYLKRLRIELPRFLDRFAEDCVRSHGIAIFNSGTDVLSGDEVGLLDLSAADIVERDAFVVGELRQHNIPVVMLLSGGYSPQSYQVIAESAANRSGNTPTESKVPSGRSSEFIMRGPEIVDVTDRTRVVTSRFQLNRLACVLRDDGFHAGT